MKFFAGIVRRMIHVLKLFAQYLLSSGVPEAKMSDGATHAVSGYSLRKGWRVAKTSQWLSSLQIDKIWGVADDRAHAGY